ncbi:MAG: hypothetical protein ACRCU2_29090 [Planktothrix sp.]
MKFQNSQFAKEATTADLAAHEVLKKIGMRGSPKPNTTTDKFDIKPDVMGGFKLTIGVWVYWVKADNNKIISEAFKAWESNQ